MLRCSGERQVQDVQQLFQLRRRMGDNTYTQLTMEFFPQGGGEKFADIFLFQVRNTLLPASPSLSPPGA